MSNPLMPVLAETPSNRQRLFIRYFTAILIDLVVLNLFAEYWKHVGLDSFTTSLLAAILLQVLLKLTILAEHHVAEFFNARPGAFMKFCRFFFAWVVLFGSKFVILEALTFVFGDGLRFTGPFNGIVALLVVVFAMLIAEEAIVRLYQRRCGLKHPPWPPAKHSPRSPRRGCRPRGPASAGRQLGTRWHVRDVAELGAGRRFVDVPAGNQYKVPSGFAGFSGQSGPLQFAVNPPCRVRRG
jgi:hypothetical protein